MLVIVLAASLAAAAPARAADPDAGRRRAEPCAACHGRDGNSTNPAVPSLAGQPAFYLHWQLILFRDQRRKDPQMAPFAANLSDADMADLAAYYAAQPPVKGPGAPGEPRRMAEGRRLAEAHHCLSCHAPRAGGAQYVPRLEGLQYEYLRQQLRGFKAQTRGELETIMTEVAQPLSDADIESLARYIADLPPAPPR